MSQDNEIFDVVDQDDRVLGQATRREVHLNSLLHRSVHVLVFNPEGELFLQKRAMTKDENPGLWDTSSAGHVEAGEDYDSSAVRELQEELGISEPLRRFAKLQAGEETFWEHVVVYVCETEKEILCDPVEISEGRFWSMENIQRAFEATPEIFTSTFQWIFSLYRSSPRKNEKNVIFFGSSADK